MILVNIESLIVKLSTHSQVTTYIFTPNTEEFTKGFKNLKPNHCFGLMIGTYIILD